MRTCVLSYWTISWFSTWHLTVQFYCRFNYSSNICNFGNCIQQFHLIWQVMTFSAKLLYLVLLSLYQVSINISSITAITRLRNLENLQFLRAESLGTRRLAAWTRAVVVLRSTSYIAIELNVLHLKTYEIQSNRCAQAILPLIVFLGID